MLVQPFCQQSIIRLKRGWIKLADCRPQASASVGPFSVCIACVSVYARMYAEIFVVGTKPLKFDFLMNLPDLDPLLEIPETVLAQVFLFLLFQKGGSRVWDHNTVFYIPLWFVSMYICFF